MQSEFNQVEFDQNKKELENGQLRQLALQLAVQARDCGSSTVQLAKDFYGFLRDGGPE
jgi:hypothetical protein